MNYPGTTMLGYVGDLFFKLARYPVNSINKWVDHHGDKVVNKFGGGNNTTTILSSTLLQQQHQRRQRVYKLLFGTSLTFTTTAIYFSIYPPSDKISRIFGITTETIQDIEIKNNSFSSSSSTPATRIRSSLSKALKYANVGDIPMMSNFLQMAENLAIENPQELNHVRLPESFSKHYQEQLQSQLIIQSDILQKILQSFIQDIDIHYQKDSSYPSAWEKIMEIQRRMNENSSNESIKTTETATTTTTTTTTTNTTPLLQVNQNLTSIPILPSSTSSSEEHTNTSKNIDIHFRSEIEYINHIGICNRCINLLNCAKRHAKQGHVRDCAETLANLWETMKSHEFPIIIPVSKLQIKNPENDNPIQQNNGRVIELKEEYLQSIMKICHRNYAFDLIKQAHDIEQTSNFQKLAIRVSEYDPENIVLAKSLLIEVWNRLASVNNYAKRYGLQDEYLSQCLKDVWQEKQRQYNYALTEEKI